MCALGAYGHIIDDFGLAPRPHLSPASVGPRVPERLGHSHHECIAEQVGSKTRVPGQGGGPGARRGVPGQESQAGSHRITGGHGAAVEASSTAEARGSCGGQGQLWRLARLCSHCAHTVLGGPRRSGQLWLPLPSNGPLGFHEDSAAVCPTSCRRSMFDPNPPISQHAEEPLGRPSGHSARTCRRERNG